MCPGKKNRDAAMGGGGHFASHEGQSVSEVMIVYFHLSMLSMLVVEVPAFLNVLSSAALSEI